VDQHGGISPASTAGHNTVGMSKDAVADAAAVKTSAEVCAFFSGHGAVARTFHLNRRYGCNGAYLCNVIGATNQAVLLSTCTHFYSIWPRHRHAGRQTPEHGGHTTWLSSSLRMQTRRSTLSWQQMVSCALQLGSRQAACCWWTGGGKQSSLSDCADSGFSGSSWAADVFASGGRSVSVEMNLRAAL
jgi:hypothetical protein